MRKKLLGLAASLALFVAVSPATGQTAATGIEDSGHIAGWQPHPSHGFDSRWHGYPPPRHFDSTVLTARPATGDIVDWGQIGSPSLTITTPQSFTSTGGTTGTVSLNGTGILVQQCCIGITGTFAGDFAPGDKVLVTSPGSPLTINFHKPVQAIGAQIQDNGIGDQFTAEIQAFHGGKLLGTFTENGFSGDVADNSNIFLGVRDAQADITSVVFLTYTLPFRSQAVAINEVTIAPGLSSSVSPH